jgi:LPXTG-site transpeptidase (sortase) family protein
MKKALSLLLVAVFLVLPLAQAEAFTDTQNTRYNVAFEYLQDRGVVQGYSDGSGKPNAPINRAETLKVLLQARSQYASRVQWFRTHLPISPLYKDMSQSDWYAPYLETAYESDLITGYPDHTFRAGKSVTVEEAVVLMMRVYGESDSEQGSEWFTNDVKNALQKNLIAKEETLYLGEPMTRGQFFDMVYRFETVKNQHIAAFVNADGSTTPHAMLARRPVPQSTLAGTSGSADFFITIPTLGISDLRVSHPADAVSSKGMLEPLKYGVGHLFNYPGTDGKIMIYGHSSGYAWDVSKFTKIFTTVHKLVAGDRVYVHYNGRDFIYEVTGQQTISPTNTGPFMGRGEELILYTCWPIGSAKERLIVKAKPVSDVAVNR